MRIMTIVSTAYLFAGLIALTTAATASELAAYAPRANATPVCTGAVYHPYGHPWFPYYAYRQAVRFSYVPTAPPATICRCRPIIMAGSSTEPRTTSTRDRR